MTNKSKWNQYSNYKYLFSCCFSMINTDYTIHIVVITLFIIVFLLTLTQNKYSKQQNKKILPHTKKQKRTFHYNIDKFNNIDNIAVLINNSCHKKKPKIDTNDKKNFHQMQYHKDYYDVITAINNLTSQKEIFNPHLSPVNETPMNMTIANDIVAMFINNLNNEIKQNVSEFLHTNSGWSDMGKRVREKSGWEQSLEELGLPGSLYNEPAKKANVKLTTINKATQYATDTQIRLVVLFVIRKKNVKDKMVLKAQFVIQTENDVDRDTFFKTKINARADKFPILTNKDHNVTIENVFILGFISANGSSVTKSDKFHDYGDIYTNDKMIDQEKVIKMMLQKHNERSHDLNTFLCSVDDDTKKLHNVPDLASYDGYKYTRTIIDDIEHSPRNSFGDIHV